MKITKTLLTISILLFKSIAGFAQWSTDTSINNPIGTEQRDQTAPRIVSDGNGGVIIAWVDFRQSTTNSNIWAQRIDSNGVTQWLTSGVSICTALNNQDQVEIISDGNGGAIIVWSDRRYNSTYTDIFAQKINAAGVVQWTTNGVGICYAPNHNYNPQIIADGNGGAIITWMDNRTDGRGDIYAQSINSSGVVQWTTNGIAICNIPDKESDLSDYPAIVSDGNNGAIITWADFRNGLNWDIYAQRVNSSGAIQWSDNGIVICDAANHQPDPTIISDNNGGAIIVWSDERNSGTSTDVYDIYAQRVNSNGIAQWETNGITICSSLNSQQNPVLISDGNGGAIIAWEDFRSSNDSPDLYAQRINSSGGAQWTTNGVPISTAADDQWLGNIIPDGNGGAIIAWQDERLGSSSADIYAQRINPNGAVQWTTNGAPISTAANIQRNPYLASDGNGGAIIAWEDYRTGTNYDVYAQRINMVGNLSTETVSYMNNSFVKAFPNPSNGRITFQSTEIFSDVYIINQLGETVYKETSVNNHKKELDLTNLSDGIYIYKTISNGNIISNGKLIIAH
ncbi:MULTISPECIES: T9SS type A sorting domain-containing protein [Flavobacterium]|uniref:T9SS type A sorting domain-containing protein n=1 Tax=Flavobacterium TaxID=237 RepID=UPI001FCCC100|nr:MULTISPECIES: T9SS type A sorting domain-containing protein [Flavobacterium]UOK43666.1 T9SS type A sorting domain-containing protein [Flavobacterium enshiense]